MNVRQLKENISYLTGKVNLNIAEYRQQGKAKKAFEQEIERLQMYGSKASPTRRAETIGLGFRGKSKIQLQRQLAELRRVEDRDVWSPSGARKITAAKNKSWLSFKKNHEDWSKEKWQNFTDTFGHLSDTLKQQFGYEVSHGDRQRTRRGNIAGVSNESLIMAYEKAYSKKVDLIQLMQEVINENKGAGMTQQDAIDKLMLKLK